MEGTGIARICANRGHNIMSDLPTAQILHRHGAWNTAGDTCTLSYDDRFLRRKVLETSAGKRFLVDLEHTESLDHGDALAWHVGNRHTPCQIEKDRLLIQRNHVMQDMLTLLGATLREVVEPFTPEGGAYGHGRTHSHEH